MSHNTDLVHFQEIINYKFKDIRKLQVALTHSSYANEKRTQGYKDNERFEFLGDAVLELTASDFLFNEYPNEKEGELTRLRASMVCEPTLAYCAREINLGEYILLGKGEDMTGGRHRDSITSDALEAIIGAIYLDSGFASAKEFIHRFILNDLDKKKLFFDSKTILQELVQSKGLEAHYELVGESGPDHLKTFEVNVLVESKIVGNGKGRTKKAAEQQAAYNTILTIRKNNSDITKG